LYNIKTYLILTPRGSVIPTDRKW